MKDASALEHKRHSLAHLLAAAVLELHPEAKPTIGPAIDTGFYYDFDDLSITEGDLATIEKKMREIVKHWELFKEIEVSPSEAKKIFAKNPYKLELIEELEKAGEKITLYYSGPKSEAPSKDDLLNASRFALHGSSFLDLCRGGHADNPAKDIAPASWKLSRVAGAYWRGNEKNKMLTRIYGLAFDTKDELAAYEKQMEEAKKRDHRKIAREQDLLVFSELVGPGMPLFTPKGNIIRNEIVKFSQKLNAELGFSEVHTPNINKGELFKISGHYDKYKDDMLTVSSQYVSDEMFLKPMNCPQHTQIYASRPRSYRDLPIRYADFAVLYRDERPGELSGLTRLRSFAQDDGHIFCREDQVADEISKVLEAIQKALNTYRIGYWMRLSLRDPEKKEKYIGEDAAWEKSEDIMRKLLQEKKIEHKEAPGEAAFYGPKIDIMAVDAVGREWQISTIQLDFNMPSRFKLEYTAEDGTKKTPVMIHRALIGSPDRFMGILIEHYAGAFPLWLAPVQAVVLPVSEKHESAAREALAALQKAGIRAELSDPTESLGKRVREVKLAKVPYWLVIGDKEADAKSAALESRGGEKREVSVETIVSKFKIDIADKI